MVAPTQRDANCEFGRPAESSIQSNKSYTFVILKFMKAAVFLVGHLRTYLDTYESLQESLKNFDTHFYVYTWFKNKYVYASSKCDAGTQDVIFYHLDGLKQAYSPKKVHMEMISARNFESHARKLLYTTTAKRPFFDPTYAYANLYLSSKITEHLAKYKQILNVENYDLVIKIRPDVLIDKVKFNIDDKLHCPLNGSFGGINNHICWGNEANMMKVFSSFKDISKHSPPRQFIPEKIIADITNIPIIREDVSYEILRCNGKKTTFSEDQSFWS